MSRLGLRERKESQKRIAPTLEWGQPPADTDDEAAPLTDAQAALIRNTIRTAFADARRESRR